MVDSLRISRGDFLIYAAGTVTLPFQKDIPTHARKPRVAVIFTAFTYRSHAHVILENILKPNLFCGKFYDPQIEIASMYGDQFPAGEMSRQVSAAYGIPIYPTIREALTLGGNNLAVDGIISIGEHGSYPTNEFGQIMYPRKQFFDEIINVMKDSGRVVPLFSDKHFSYRWDWVKEMYDTARTMHIPFMAGSSVPLAYRSPNLEIPLGSRIEEILVVHGGGPDAYDFHALEVLQSLTEARHGAERGVKSVQCLSGEAIWKAAEQKLWNPALVEVALRREMGDKAADWRKMTGNSYLTLVRYRDGLIAPALSIPGNRWAAAVRLRGKKPQGCNFDVGPWMNRNLFKALTHAIQYMMVTGKAPYPVERTLLTTGMTEGICRSRTSGGTEWMTSYLNVHYRPMEFKLFRENGESWKVLTDNEPEPKGMEPLN